LTTLTASQQLARWIASHREAGLSDDVLDKAQTFVLDWLASALGGRGTLPGRAVLDYTRTQPEGSSRVAGETVGRSAEAAAFANGALSHIVEMDDVDRLSIIHPGAVVIPAALAVAERDNRSGRDFLSAVVAGYEVAIRIGAAVGKKHYFHFHNTSTCGVFGAAAAAGWLNGLDEDALAWALGSAGSMASGVWQFNAEGAMTKHLHTGHAAASGIRAADLAALGFTGPKAILEGERGFFAGFAPDGAPEQVTANLDGDGFALPLVSLKPYASCRHTHAAVDAALALRDELSGRAVERATVHVYQSAADLCDNETPVTPYEAKFSLQYCISRALSRGSLGLVDFSIDDIGPIDTPAGVVVDPSLTDVFPSEFPARLELELDDGTTIVKQVRHPLGDPENPLSRARVEAKLRELAAYGGLSEERTTAYLDWVHGLSKDVLTPETRSL